MFGLDKIWGLFLLAWFDEGYGFDEGLVMGTLSSPTILYFRCIYFIFCFLLVLFPFVLSRTWRVSYVALHKSLYFVMHLNLFIINELTFLEFYQFSHKDLTNGLLKVQRSWLLARILTRKCVVGKNA